MLNRVPSLNRTAPALLALTAAMSSVGASAAVSVIHVTDSVFEQLVGENPLFAATGRFGDSLTAQVQRNASAHETASVPGAVNPQSSTRARAAVDTANPVGAALRSGDFELGLGYSLAEPATTRNFQWTNENPQSFSFEYDAETNKFSYALGGQTLKYASSSPYSFSDMYIRAHAVGENETFVRNLTLNGQSIGSVFSAGGGADILRVQGLDFSHDFTLTGQAMLTWLGQPRPDDLGFQFAFGQVLAVPEPSEAMMLVFGIACVAGFARLRKNQ
jgi:hypothetical protein